MSAGQRSAPTTTAGRGPSLLARRPELLPIGLAIAGWAAVIWFDRWTGSARPASATSGDHAHDAGAHAGHLAAQDVSPGWPAADGLATTVMTLAMILTITVAMTLAMMSPLAVPGARTAAFTSRWWRAGRAATWFNVGFLAAWTALTVPLALAATAAVAWWGRTAAVVALLGCAVLQLVPGRRRRMEACDRPTRLRDAGRGADAECARFGVLSALRGAPLCGPPMLAMLLAPGGLLMMAVISGFVLIDRIREGRAALLVAGGYGAVAAAVLLWL